ncbi:MAG TPA: hypothetical protein VFM88_20525 [Vicinamibacteria bacterium]|nr:hypothetical protein [Vicinamibacteria bacterium]
MPALLQAFEQRGTRLRVYALLALGFFLLALAGTLRHGEFNFIHADGRAYYVYLPSLILDGDLDFRNQMELWRVGFNPLSPENRTPTGLVFNKYTIGLALSLLPAFLAGHALALALHAVSGSAFVAPDGFSPPYQCLGLAAILAYAFGTVAIADAWLVERFRVPGWCAAAAVASFWVGSNYAYYSFREPFMAHVVSAFWVTSAAALAVRLHERLSRELEPGLVLRLAAVTSMALVCRPSNLVLAPFLAGVVLEARRTGQLGRLARALPAAAPGLLPLALQLLTWRAMSGAALLDPYPAEGFTNWNRPYLLHTLFHSRHGLFYWSPVLLLAALGLVLRVRRDGFTDPLLRGYLGAFVLLWYLNSAWYAWWFGESFGGRAFLELAGLFVVGLGLCLDAARASVAALAGATAFMLLGAVWNWLLVALWALDRIRKGWDPWR